jgi:light-regulated signal transduction histidine kinase (bacteriophytochrome)
VKPREHAQPAAPAFGQADLSNCEREQIQHAGSIQPHGALLLAREPDQLVVQASANAADFLGLAGEVLGCTLAQLQGDLAQCIGAQLEGPLHSIPIAVRCRVGRAGSDFDCLLHRPAGGGLVLELERAGPPVDVAHQLDSALRAIVGCSSLRALGDEAARIFKALIGYDRVMVYRFDDDGHGEVFAERREAHLEPYLGNRYPASDIPQIARRLYERNRVRVLVDVAAASVPLVPRLSPLGGQNLDMSLCFLRSMSPIHIQYLKNMGVCATLVASLMVNGKLWGLIACHHYVPRFVHYEIRALCELLAEAVATRIAALEFSSQAQAELSVRRLEQRMIEAIGREGDWRGALFENARLLEPLDASGAALLFDGQIQSAGEVPGTQVLRELAQWLDGRPRTPVLATSCLGVDEPRFAAIAAVASGMLATPVSNSPGEYLLWFRPERVRTVTWGGNPFEAVKLGDDPSQLSPRRSFAQWHQVVKGTADPWTPADLTMARVIGESVADVVLQFRSVRMLIAQDQLAQAAEQVQVSDQAVVIADAQGHILHANAAARQLLVHGNPPPQQLEALTTRFVHPADARRSVRELLQRNHPWRGEVGVKTGADGAVPLLVRADPVLVPPRRLLGFVLLFTDLAERRAADAARRQFQEDLVERRRATDVTLDSQTDLLYRDLLLPIMDNAQLAALEITDGADPASIPAALEGVRTSVARTAQLLRFLIRHAAGTAAQPPREERH